MFSRYTDPVEPVIASLENKLPRSFNDIDNNPASVMVKQKPTILQLEKSVISWHIKYT
jgi:hypothetical protein